MTDKETRRLIEEKEARERVKRLNAVITKVLAGMKPPDDLTVTEWAEKTAAILRVSMRWNKSGKPQEKQAV